MRPLILNAATLAALANAFSGQVFEDVIVEDRVPMMPKLPGLPPLRGPSISARNQRRLERKRRTK